MRTTDPKDYDAEDDLTMDGPCVGGHPMKAVVLDGHGGISCTVCGFGGREVDATVHPGGEACRRAGCHEATDG